MYNLGSSLSVSEITALVAMIGEPRRIADVRFVAGRLSDALLLHLDYEEQGRLAVDI